MIDNELKIVDLEKIEHYYCWEKIVGCDEDVKFDEKIEDFGLNIEFEVKCLDHFDRN